MSKTLSVDEVLSLSINSKPSFSLNSKPSAFFLDKDDPSFKKPEKKQVSNAEILKPAQINKEAFNSLRDFEKSYQNFKDLNELVNLSRDPANPEPNNPKKEENPQKIEKSQPKVEVLPQAPKANKEGPPPEKKADNRKSKKIVKKPRSTIKDREKNQRKRGQSSISTWKSEAFMKLRQQYD